MIELFSWIQTTFPQLKGVIKWNQPMFTDHGTFIIGFSRARKHMSFSLEEAVISLFSKTIQKAGYEQTKMLAKIKWDQSINYDLLKQLIAFNIQDKAECTTFFRTKEI